MENSPIDWVGHPVFNRIGDALDDGLRDLTGWQVDFGLDTAEKEVHFGLQYFF